MRWNKLMIVFPFFCLFSLLARRDSSNPNIILDLSRNSKLLNKQEKKPKTWQNIVGSKAALETQMQSNKCRNFCSLARVESQAHWHDLCGEEPRKRKRILLITRWHFGALRDFIWLPRVVFLWHHVFVKYQDSINLRVFSLSGYY